MLKFFSAKTLLTFPLLVLLSAAMKDPSATHHPLMATVANKIGAFFHKVSSLQSLP